MSNSQEGYFLSSVTRGEETIYYHYGHDYAKVMMETNKVTKAGDHVTIEWAIPDALGVLTPVEDVDDFIVGN